MKTYTIHIKPDLAAPLENAIFVKEGFALWAFVFHVFWALYHRIWWLATVIVVVMMVLATLRSSGVLDDTSYHVVKIGLMLIIGFNAQDWYSDHLRQQGYVITGVVSGRNLEEAQQRCFDYYTDTLSKRNRAPELLTGTMA